MSVVFVWWGILRLLPPRRGWWGWHGEVGWHDDGGAGAVMVSLPSVVGVPPFRLCGGRIEWRGGVWGIPVSYCLASPVSYCLASPVCVGGEVR